MARRLKNPRYEPRAEIVSDPPDPDADCFFGEVDLDDAVRQGDWLDVEFVHDEVLYKGRAEVVAINSEAGIAEVKGHKPTATEAS
jgi:hypothetical protein